jgi:hypothetical protein
MSGVKVIRLSDDQVGRLGRAVEAMGGSRPSIVADEGGRLRVSWLLRNGVEYRVFSLRDGVGVEDLVQRVEQMALQRRGS